MRKRLGHVAALLAALGLAGCAADPAPDEPPSTRPGPETRPAETAGGERPEGRSPDAEAGGYTLEAMVGHINGEPLYAEAVLAPIAEQLRALAENPEVGRSGFERRARELIRGRLRQLVADQLLLGEARRELSGREKKGLERHMKKKREELIRKWGAGSRAVADKRLRAETGKGLAATIRERREAALVQRHLRQQLKPRMEVSRREVKRYYRRHREKFNPPAKREIRLIRVESDERAKRVEKALANGTPFREVASNPKLNTYKPDQAGLFGKSVTGDDVFASEAVNDAIAELEAGAHAGKFRLGGAWAWVQVAEIARPEGRSLKEAQLEIEKKLRQRRYRNLTSEYRKRLFEQGSYRRLSEMARTLQRIAVARYLGPKETE